MNLYNNSEHSQQITNTFDVIPERVFQPLPHTAVQSTSFHSQNPPNRKNSPSYYLELFIDEAIISWLISETKQNAASVREVFPEEMRCFVAILYLSGYVDVPRRRMLWERSPDTHCSLVANAMQRDRFECIFTALQGNASGLNYLERLRHLVDRLNENFFCLAPVDEQHSIAECAISLKYPKLKSWCACIKSGYCLWFAPCVSQTDNSYGRNIILQYAGFLQSRKPGSYTLLFENRFAETPFVYDLQKMGIQAAGVDKNGSCLLNPAAGGVDRMDCNIGLYRSAVKGKKPFLTVLTFTLDLAMQNAWQIYRTDTNDNKPLDLLAFRRNIVIYYLQHYAKPLLGHRGGRPSKSLRGRKGTHSEARYDGIRHYVVPQSKQTRCARCSAKTTTRCQKCNVGVHVKCFVDYHQKPKADT